jgi:hypothetical protein
MADGIPVPKTGVKVAVWAGVSKLNVALEIRHDAATSADSSHTSSPAARP